MKRCEWVVRGREYGCSADLSAEGDAAAREPARPCWVELDAMPSVGA
jgi:hypothetical protein